MAGTRVFCGGLDERVTKEEIEGAVSGLLAAPALLARTPICCRPP